MANISQKPGSGSTYPDTLFRDTHNVKCHPGHNQKHMLGAD